MVDYKVKIHNSISQIDKDKYNSIQDKNNPFFEYDFLNSLELSKCIGPVTGWDPRYLTLYDKEKIIGSLVFFIKTDSYGEFIFDWEWARAYERSGLDYYPKAVLAIPFTPTNGTRIFIHNNYNYEICATKLIYALVDYCSDQNLSSIHCLFLNEKELSLFSNAGFLSRITHQYHWHNRDYTSFDDFLSDLKSSKRKQIRKERNYIEKSNIDIEVLCGNDVKQEHIDAIWQFYFDTNNRKWGNTYLNYDFFDLIHKNFSDKIVIVLAKQDGYWIGGTINFRKNKKLFGRYWGALKYVKNLHFECCYYKLIEYAIDNKIEVFEAGAQGEHKFLRGFAAVPIYSSHLLFNESAKNAISNYLVDEKKYTMSLIKSYNRQSPLKYLQNVENEELEAKYG